MPGRSFISALIYSIRPSACIGIALFATAGLGRWDDLFITILTFSAAFIGGAGCFLINDIFDREKDLKNNKLRPIATGEISVKTAFTISVICCLVMLVACIFLSLNTFIFAVLLIVGFWLYPYINLHFGLLSNIWVSVCSILAFFNGAMVYELTPLIYLAMFSTLFVNTGREILLDGLDQAGDRAVGKPSIPLMYGEKRTEIIVSFLYLLGSIAMLVYLRYFPGVWPWISILLLLIWVPFSMKRKEGFRKWALFNVRTSHIFFGVLIVLLFVRPASGTTDQKTITAEYCRDKLVNLQSKQDGFYPEGIFPTNRSWFSKKPDEDNGVFATAFIAYILRSKNEREPNYPDSVMLNQAILSFEKYRSRRGEAQYNFYQSVGGDVPFPNSFLLSGEYLRLPDDYDDTALIQLARGPHKMDQPVRDRMLEYAMRTKRKAVEHFPSKYRASKAYEVWYANKMKQDLDIVVMANVMLFVIEKGYPLQTPDRHSIKCLKTSIDEGWYFKDPEGYAPYYLRPAIIMYSLARLIEKDTTDEFKPQREKLIRDMHKALSQTDHSIEKVMIATSLRRLGENVNLILSRDHITRDAQSFAYTASESNDGIALILPSLYWRSEALSWALLYELFSFDQTIQWT